MGNRIWHNNYYFLGLFLLLATLSGHSQENQNESTQNLAEKIFSEAIQIKYENPNSALILLQTAHEEYLKAGDTLKGIWALLELADTHGHGADYSNSYDAFWKSLFLADQIKNDSLIANITLKLGRFYSFYKRKEQSIQYLQNSLNITKAMVAKNELDQAYLVHNYYAFCSTYRELDEPLMAEKYLDSCLTIYKDIPGQVKMGQLRFEKAVILTKKDKNEEALHLMQELEPWFEENRPSYMVLVYTYWGDIYKNMSDLINSEIQYKKALQTSERYKSHIDFTPLIYERLTDLHLEKGSYQQAFLNQQMAKKLDAQFFDSRSERNRSLLEIKDEFRLEKERQEKLIQEQRLNQLEQEEKISLLQLIILWGAIIFMLSIGFLYFRHLRSKHKIEKQLIQRKNELEIKKAEEVLELKNKELATSALQLVEKDEFLKELKSKLKKDGDSLKPTEINRILRSISVSNNNNWEEFRLRFTAVNEKFYKKLNRKYPNLSQSDQKICALIKLNFSSKDMARLLGISVESVHTTRYRLRKKLGLSRSVNLEDFIATM